MKRIFLTALFVFGSLQASAVEFFKDGKPAPFEKGALVERWSTAGGYSIYTGGDLWRIVDVTTQVAGAINNADEINRGTVVLVNVDSNFQDQAVQVLTTNLSSASMDQFVTGSPCSGTHIVAVNKARGRDDNCMTINVRSVQSRPRDLLVFDVRIVNFKSAGRAYVVTFHILANALNFGDTTPADWTPAGLEASAERKALIARMRTWAESLQDAANKASDFSKPQDVFDNIPSYKTLAANP